jgi:hypothetical protein
MEVYMARHKVGNSFLSDDELETHKSENWKFWLFLIVGLFAGFITFALTKTIEIKFIRFSLVIASGITFGFLAAKFSEAIRWCFAVAAVLGFLYFIGSLIWNAL